GEGLAGLDHAAPDPGHAIPVGGVDAVAVESVRVGAGVGEVNPDAVALVAADRRAGHGPVISPGREEDARRDLDLLIDRDDAVLTQRLAVLELAGGAVVEVGEELGRVEAHSSGVDIAD